MRQPALSSPQLQKLAANQPDYAPAGCNVPDPKPGYATCDALVKTDKLHRLQADASTPPATALTPSNIQAAYDLPGDGGAGQTVAIVDAYGDSSAESDLAVFRSEYGLPACTSANGCFRMSDQIGGTDFPADDAGWATETSLDLDAVSATCPACHILLIQANSATVADLGTATDTAVRLGAKFVSNSYGISGEDPSETGYADYDHSGVVIAAAAGDIANVVNWPASDPDVVAVGGTSLKADTASARGWDETVWTSGGSGCSKYEPQPAYQVGLGTGCARRATADISADADPYTGLAIYDTLGQSGWLQAGGTSLAAPLVTAMYAMAGDPAPGTFPVTYPYVHGGSHLFDVTQGSNGGCGNVLCSAGVGWDGPTGLGTPDGLGALTLGSVGVVSGRVTTGSDAAPVPHAAVVLTDPSQGTSFHLTADAQGGFSMTAEVGDYTVTASDFGYTSATTSVHVAEGQTTSAGLTLTALPTETVSGTVTDGSGHGWPVYAAITVAGDPNGEVYTNPKTGAYSVNLPRQDSYALHVNPVYAGYEPADATVAVGDSAVKQDFSVATDPSTCDAPGYAYPLSTGFEGWTGSASQNSWTVSANNGSAYTWEFDNPGGLGNLTSGSGNFATADSFDHGEATVDSDLTTPVMDLSNQPAANLEFDGVFVSDNGSATEIDLSTDGGTTWTSAWNPGTTVVDGPVTVPLTAVAGKSDVRLRFHFNGAGVTLFQLDDVSVGTCSLVAGGLLEGTVTDANTGKSIDGAVITDRADPSATVTSFATPNDANLHGGFYWLFSKGIGRHVYTVADDRYVTLNSAVTTRSNTVVQDNPVLQAGQLMVAPGKVSMSEALGQRRTRDVILTNTGKAPLHVDLGEQHSGSTTAGSNLAGGEKGAPTVRIPGHFTPGLPTSTAVGSAGPAQASPKVMPAADGSWQLLPAYPEPVADNAVGYFEGKAYSVGGESEAVGGTALADGFVYDPVSASWSPIASLPQPLVSASAAFLDGTMYVVGGWNATGLEQTTVYVYHPASNTWSLAASLPQGVSTADIAVLDGSLYVIGGCTQRCATDLSTVYRYSPAANAWTTVAALPETMQRGACAGLTDEIVCAGGVHFVDGKNVSLSATYIYSPARNSWTQAASMPYTAWGMMSSGADGELQIVGGIVSGEGTNEAEQYDPVHNVWTALPNPALPVFEAGGSSCGMYQIGGSSTSSFFPVGTTTVQVLPGFDQCGGDQVSWLSEDRRAVELAPGKSIDLQITADAGQLATPGDYSAELTFTTDAPYVSAPTDVSLHVIAPASWTEISGKVTSAGSGDPLAGVAVQICATQNAHAGKCSHPLYDLATDSSGAYALWLPGGPDTADVVADAPGYLPQTRRVAIRRGGSSVVDFTLAQS